MKHRLPSVTAGKGTELVLAAAKDGRGKGINPNQIIPLDEDEFKEF
jgi:hypothetical protein